MSEIENGDTEFMRQALAQAVYAERKGEIPVGAVLVFNKRIIAKGYNQPISGNDPTAHAEIVAIREAARALNNYRMPGATLYVTLEPCTMCIGAMIHARIHRLVYATEEPRSGAVISAFRLLQSKNYNHQITVASGILKAESAKLLKEFFGERRSGKLTDQG